MKISACMIAKNESKNIERCINSYKDIVDEIIVVDTGSTDNSVEIAESLGAKVLFRAWDYDFSAAKNFALDNANGDWVVFLDADEYLVGDSKWNLLKTLKRVDKKKNIEAIESPIYNINSEDGRVFDITPTIRIFRKTSDIRYVGRIHEAPKKGDRYLYKYNDSSIHTYHSGYSRDIIDSKLDRNIKLLESEAKKEDIDPIMYYYLAENYTYIKKYEDAIRYADMFINQSDFITLVKKYPQTFRIFIHRSNSMFALRDVYSENDIFQVISEGIEIFPNHPELKKLEAEIYLELNKIDKALESYKEAHKLNKNYNDFYSNKFVGVVDKVLYQIGEIYLLKGDRFQAYNYYMESIKSNKYNVHSINRIIRMIKNEGNSEIITLLNSIYDLNEFKDIEFLSTYLAKQKITVPFLFYFIKNWKWEYDNYGSLMVIALLLKGDTAKALETAFSLLMKEKNDANELYTSIALIFGNHLNWHEKNRQHLSRKYQKILDGYFKLNLDTDFTEDELKCYHGILRELFTFENKIVFHRFITETPTWMVMSYETIGNILNENSFYELAIDYYKKIVNSENCKDNERGRSTLKMGLCYYHMQAYKESIDCYERALLVGNNKSEAIQFLKWIVEKDIDYVLKNRINYLIEQHSQIPF